jgi:hypothetical protein
VVPNHALYQAKLRPELVVMEVDAKKYKTKNKGFIRHFYPAYLPDMPKFQKERVSLFEKVGECLYRYRPSGVYYAGSKPTARKSDGAFAQRTDKLQGATLMTCARNLEPWI